MRRLVILSLIALLTLVAVSYGQEYELPICTDLEFFDLFNMIVERQIQIDDPIADIDDLLSQSESQLENREASLSQLPLCADAIGMRRLFTQLNGDAIGRAALELAGVSADDNPYRKWLATDYERIEALGAAMLSVNRTETPPPDERAVPDCIDEDIDIAGGLRDEFLALLNASAAPENPEQYIDSIDDRLRWREDNLVRFPDCAEAIELALVISEVATDAAARVAFTYAGLPSDKNPYVALEAEGAAQLRNWENQSQASAVSLVAEFPPVEETASQLPDCTIEELSAAYHSLLPGYTDLLALAETTENVSDLLSVVEEQIAFRSSSLSQLPICAEALSLGWLIEETLSDTVTNAAFLVTGGSVVNLALDERAIANSAAVSTAIDELTAALDGVDQTSAAPATSNADACSDTEIVYLYAYLVPEFRGIADAALAMTSRHVWVVLIDQSLAFRDLLWSELPRCDEALELGLTMRQVVADFIAMLSLESAGVAAEDIAYLREIASGLESYFALYSDLLPVTDSTASFENPYYVVADNFANIRDCASTDCAIVESVQRGQILDVLDASGSWYEIQMEEGESAFIAGFLMSKTPPDA